MRRIWLTACCMIAMGMSCPHGEDLLAAYSFTALIPPSNMFTVGSVVAVEDDCADGVETSKYKLVCGPRASLGKHFIARSSRTINQALRDKSKTTWNIEGETLEAIQLQAGAEQVKSIKAHLVNAKILSLSDADVIEGLPFRSEGCKQAIAARLEQGYTVTMIGAALIADMDFKVEWKESKTLSKKARLVSMQKVAASLGGGQQRIGLKTIESKGLALGVRTDAFLLALSLPDGSKMPDDQNRADYSKIRKPGRALADSDPDSELVLPPAGYMMPEYDFDDD